MGHDRLIGTEWLAAGPAAICEGRSGSPLTYCMDEIREMATAACGTGDSESGVAECFIAVT